MTIIDLLPAFVARAEHAESFDDAELAASAFLARYRPDPGLVSS